MRKDGKTIIKIYFFLFILYLLLNNINSFQFFKEFTLLSDDIALITDQGIIKYDQITKEQTIIQSLSLIKAVDDQNYISFTQLPISDGGYIFIRIKQYVFIYDRSLNTYYQNFTIDGIVNYNCIINSYKNTQEKITLMISYISNNQRFKVLMYEINIGQTDNLGVFKYQNEQQALNQNRELKNVINKAISCELMKSSNYTNKLLTCFILDQESNSVNAIVFNPENSLSFLYFSENLKQTQGTTLINSILSTNNSYSLICFIEDTGYLRCLLYDSEKNKFSNIIKVFENCQKPTYTMGVKYSNEKQEYYVYCSTSSNYIYFLKFDQDFNIKENENNNKCYISFNFYNNECNMIYSSPIIYIENDNKYYSFRSCFSNNEYSLSLLNINETCNNEIENIYFFFNILIIPSTLLIESTIILDSSSLTSKIESTTPNFTSTPEIENESTLLELGSKSSISEFEQDSTILSTENESTLLIESQTSISEIEIESSISKIESSISKSESSILENKSSILEIESSIPKIESSILEIKSSILEIKSSILENNSSILEIKSSIPKIESSILESNLSILEIESSISEIKSSILKISSNILENELSSSIWEIKNEASSLFPSSTFLSSSQIQLTFTEISSPIIKSESNSSLKTSSLISDYESFSNEKRNFIDFYVDGDINKGKITINKEEIVSNLKNIMDIIENGKKYMINGNNYNITISPINDLDTFKSSFIDFSLCEETLRKQYNIPFDEILTVLQIEIDKMNEKALTNQ